MRVQPTSEWDDLDFLLFEAFIIYDAERQDGIPVWMRYRTDGGALFSVESGIDAAAAALEEWDKKHEKTKKKGQYRYPVMVDENGNPREVGGLERESYYRGQPLEPVARGDSVPDLLDELGIERRRPSGGYNTGDYGDPV